MPSIGVDECLARLDDARTTIGGIAWWDPEVARTAVVHDGPLRGVPITVKDWIDVAGFPCAGVDVGNQQRRPEHDATVVARLRAAGAVVVAKTCAGDDTTRNPHDHTRSPGASSSGDAALVGVGAVPIGIGSDSGGSIRLPAAWCGVFGFKPSAGRVPNTGHFPRIGARHDSRTQIGPLARNVADIECVLRVINGPDGIDTGVAPVPLADPMPVGQLRVAWFVDDGPGVATPAVADAVSRAVAALRKAGATIVDNAVPAHLDESFDITQRYWRRRTLTGPQADDLLWDWDRFTRRMLQAGARYDIVVCPVTAGTASRTSPERDEYVFTLPASLTGAPAISVPAGVHDGLPIAVQLVGTRWHDLTLLAAADALAPRL